MVSPRPGDEYAFDPRAYEAILTWLRLVVPDVVHTHLYPAHLHASLAAAELRVPAIVHTAHTLVVRTGDVVLARTTPAHTIATAHAVERILVAAGLPPERIHVVYNGIGPQHFAWDEQRVRRAKTELALQTGPVIGVVARLSYEKGVDSLIRAFAEVRNLVAGAQLVIVGDGPERHALEGLVAQLDLTSVVRFLGVRDDVDVLNRLWDVFALPSREEACPIALLEAMAAGCAVVACDVGGVAELVQHQREGLLVPGGDSHALVQALVALLRDVDRRRSLGSAARTRAATFSVETMLDQTLSVYQRALR
jgi:glycosyltransferase involved in cell wall biosynthesis